MIPKKKKKNIAVLYANRNNPVEGKKMIPKGEGYCLSHTCSVQIEGSF